MVVEQSNSSAQSTKRKSATETTDAENSYSWMDNFDVGEEGQPVETHKNGQQSEGNSFADMYEHSLQQDEGFREGQVLEGKVVSVGPEFVTLDIGYKCEGQIPLSECHKHDGTTTVSVGDTVTAMIVRLEAETGYVQLSKNRADVIKVWDEIARACENNEFVEGTVVELVKGGLSVDIGVKAFLPGSQVDVKPVKNLDRYLGKKLKFKIIKFNKKRGNIVLSHRMVVSEEKNRLKAETLAHLEEGQVLKGTVKNITDYGAFLDLGGMDGLLHITDMSWGRVKHPSELFKVGDELTVKVLKYDREKERVSLGLKQVTANPWEEVATKFSVGDRVKGRVVSLKDYGAFIELAQGIEGLIHVSEMSWRRDLKHPSKILNVGDEVECQVLEVDAPQKRLSLGLKQLQENPWDVLSQKYPAGTRIEGTVKSIADFGIFVDIGAGIDGLVHVSDMSWLKKVTNPSEKFKKGDKVQVVVLSVDKKSEKFSLGMKQAEKDPWENAKSKYKHGAAVQGKVTKVTDFGAFVELEEGIEGLVHINELADQRVEKPSDVVKVGDAVQAEVINFDLKERKISLSCRRLRQTEERKNFETYGGSGAKEAKTSLGDVLGERLKGILNKGE